LNFPFIDDYVPALAPQLQCSAICRECCVRASRRMYTGIVREQSKMSSRWRGASFIYRLYNTGAGTEPWSTLPLFICLWKIRLLLRL
jgi:hypothetical protein